MYVFCVGLGLLGVSFFILAWFIDRFRILAAIFLVLSVYGSAFLMAWGLAGGRIQ